MLDDIKPVSGRKGGKGGGSSRTPYEAPDNLLTDSTAYLIDVVSEGEIEGWADADNPGTCIYFDDTPLQNADGSFNFEGVEYWLRTGTPDQEPVPGFSAVENEVGVSVQVEEQQPVARSITAADVDAVRVKVGVASLSTLNTENGDLTEASVEFVIEMQAGAGGWEPVGNYAINGKTTSGYQRAYRVELPEVRPVSIRVRRTTPDTESSNVQDDLYFVSYTEIIDAKLRYPDTAYVALAVPASAFGGRVPRRSYRLKGVKCWVPSNYDPVARTYDESTIWDGTFQRAFTSNPAFLTYTVLLENRWGLGERISPEFVDKWRIYQIGKYCDELVPDGLGGMEPRFTMNGVMNTREAAYQVITQLSAAFRGVTYWGAGAVVPVQDAPSDPVKIVTNANVVEGAFNYAGTGLSARKTAVVTSYRHADDHFKVKAGLVFEDHDAIQRYGRRQVDTTLPFTSSRGEALRTAKWIVDTNLTSQETVSYQAGFDHAAIRPGDKLLISDKHRIGFRVGGRIEAVAGDRLSVALDAPVSIEAGESYRLLIATDVGEYLTVDVDTDPGDGITDLGLMSALPANVTPGAVFVLSATDMEPRLFRVVSNTPEKHLFNIVALEDDAEKYNRVELGINVADDAPYVLPTSDMPAPPIGLNLRAFVRPDPGSKSKLRLLASWSPSDNPLVLKYLVRAKEPNGVWRDVGDTTETSLEITPQRDDVGTYQVRVHAVTVLGEPSPFAAASVENSDVFPRPATPTGWQGEPGHDSVTLWGNAHPAPDFKAFVIYGAEADDPTLLRLDEVTTTRYVRRVFAGATITRYAVTAINHNGDESFPTDFITVSPAPPRIEDLHIEVGQAIEAAQAAADGAAADAVQALQDAADVQADHNALTNGFTGTLNAALSQRDTGIAAAQAAADDVQADHDALVAGFTGGTIEGAIDALRAENEANIAPLGVSILREPRSLWSRDVHVVRSELVKPAVTTGLFITDDADFGECFEFGGVYNTNIGPAYPVEFDPNRVYRITARYKVVDDNGGAGVRLHLGVSTQTGTAIVQSNIQSELHSPWLLAADGPQTSVRYVSGDAAALDAYGIAGSDRIVLTGSASANKLYPQLRQNSGGSTSGKVRVASIEVVDVTEALSGVNALRTELQSNIDGVSATLANDYYTAVGTDQAISAAQQTLQSNIDGVASDLQTNHYTIAQTDGAISAATTALQAQMESPSGSIGSLSATLTSDYSTTVQMDQAISAAQTTLQSSIDGVSADLSNNYYTSVQVDGAISTAQTTLQADIDDVFSDLADALPSDFSEHGRFWTESIWGATAATGDVDANVSFVTTASDGPICRIDISTTVGSNNHIAPRGRLPYVVGRKYKITVTARLTGVSSLGDGRAFNIQFRGLNGSYGSVSGATSTVTPSFISVDAWEVFTHEFEATDQGAWADIAHLLPFAYRVSSYVRAGAYLDIKSIVIEDVTEAGSIASNLQQNYSTTVQMDQAIALAQTTLQSTIDGVAANLSNNYYTEAQTDAAISSATTALQAQMEAPAGSIGSLSATLNSDYYTSVQTDGAISAAVTTLEATFGPSALSNGCLQTPTLTDQDAANWTRWGAGGSLTVSDNAVFAHGKSLRFNILSTQNDGIYTDSNRANWIGPTDLDAYVLELDFTLHSGGLGGLYLRMDWDGQSSDHYRGFDVSNPNVRITGNAGGVQRASVILQRPAGYTGPFSRHQVYIFCNYNWGGLAVDKDIELHRCFIRPATPEETGSGILADTLNAEITDIKGLEVDASTAFGTLMQQLAVNAGGTSATITNHASAVADLNGFSSAFAGVTVDTNGGNIAGFRATSFANPDGSGNGVLELLGDVVAEGTLSTNKLVVGLGRNLLSNTDFSDGLQGWNFAANGDQSGQTSISLRPPGVWAGAYFPVLQIYQNSTGTSGVADLRHRPFITDGVLSVGVPVTPGDWIEASAHFSIHRCVAELRIQYYDASGASLSYSPVLGAGNGVSSSSTNPDVWPVYWGKHQVPANAAFATVHIRKGPTNSGTNSYLMVHKPQLAVSHASATQPAPFSPGGTTLISGDKIMTGAITAESAILASASVVEANIQDLAVSTLKIKDQAVTIPVYVQDNVMNNIYSTTDWVTVISAVMDREGYATALQFTAQIDGYNDGNLMFGFARNGGHFNNGFTQHIAGNGSQTNVTISAVDTNTGTGPTTYSVHCRRVSGLNGHGRVFKKFLSAHQFKK